MIYTVADLFMNGLQNLQKTAGFDEISFRSPTNLSEIQVQIPLILAR